MTKINHIEINHEKKRDSTIFESKKSYVTKTKTQEYSQKDNCSKF